MNAGERSWDQIKKGVPVRLEVGPRDIANDGVFMGRRDMGPKDKLSMKRGEIVDSIGQLLAEIQDNLYQRALAYREAATVQVSSAEELEAFFADDQPGGFAWAFAADDPSYGERLKSSEVSARCFPVDDNDERGACIFTGMPDQRRVVFARSY
jgi:prolyl-tRNA synthetase